MDDGNLEKNKKDEEKEKRIISGEAMNGTSLLKKTGGTKKDENWHLWEETNRSLERRKSIPVLIEWINFLSRLSTCPRTLHLGQQCNLLLPDSSKEAYLYTRKKTLKHTLQW